MNKAIDCKTVFLITIDALRPDHLRSYGYDRNTSPNLEKFVKNGTLFLNAITNGPATPSSFSAIFTSILPYLNGGYSPLPLQKITFPQILHEYGINNFAIHSNPNLGKFFNYGRGFDYFLEGESYEIGIDEIKDLRTKQIFKFHIKKILSKQLVRKLLYRIPGFNTIKNKLRKKIPGLTRILLPFMPIAYNAPYVVNKVIDFLKNVKGSLFLWAHFMDVHRPYNPPTENVLKFRQEKFTRFERNFLTNEIKLKVNKGTINPKHIDDLKTLYDAEVNFVDESLYHLFNFIKERFQNDCLIIITSDHGEAFNEHGTFGHQGTVFEELLRVPLFMIELGVKNNVKNVQETVQLIDLAPTVLDYFDIDIPEDFQGKSLLPLLKGKTLNRNSPVITECFQKGGYMKRNNIDGYKLISIRKDDWKYIYDEESDKEYLFNLLEDPKEKKNLISKNSNKLEVFKLIKDYHLSKVMSSTEKSKLISVINKLNLG